jgi:hypothetical protein
MKYIVSFFLVVGFFSTQAQIGNLHDFSGKPLAAKPYDGIEGSPYLSAEWTTGKFTYGKKQYENMGIRYNAYSDEMELLKEGQPFVPDKKMVVRFELAVRSDEGLLEKYEFVKAGELGEQVTGIKPASYVRILHEGKINLCQKISIEQISVKPPEYGANEIKRFVIKKEFYVIRDNKAVNIKLTKKAIMKEFPEAEAPLKEYFKENNIDLNRTADAVQVFQFLNKLNA